MKRLLFTFLALCLAVAGSAQSGQMTSKLPTIDITKEYPKKKLVLQDIATAEYIPLETSDKVLLDGVATLHCSFTEHYITTYNANEGQIFVFDRKGKICHTFNHKGERTAIRHREPDCSPFSLKELPALHRHAAC